MVSNQIEFGNKFPKEVKEIELKYKKFQGKLVIEDYPMLEKMCLRNVKIIDKITLKNLPQLQECTIWGCGMQDLVIENCPQLKKINVRSNSLTNLEFLANLENLEDLEIDGNAEIKLESEHLPKSLKNFSLIELVKQSSRELSKKIRNLEKENDKLKEQVKEHRSLSPSITLDNPNSIDYKEKYQKIKETLKFFLEKKEIKTEEIAILEEEKREIGSAEEEQTDIVSSEIKTGDLLKKIKEEKHNLSELEKTNQELREKFTPFEQVYQKIEKKEKELEKLKNATITKNNLEEDDLEDILEAQASNDFKRLERTKKKLTKALSEKEIDDLLHLQSQIIQLQKNFDQREQQISQITGRINPQELIKLLIKKELKEENIEEVFFCNAWFNENCAIVISSKKKGLLNFSGNYNLWIAIYEPPFGKIEGKLNYLKAVEKISPVKEEWGKIINDFKTYLNDEYPAAKLYNNAYITKLPSLVKDYKNLAKTTKILLSNDNPDDYLKPLDMVKVDRGGGTYQHVAIYLGDWNGKQKQVAHVRRDDGLGTRVGNWEDFLKKETKIEIFHPFIPFKKPELIKEHVKTATDCQYGKGEYDLWKENCEHFATLCIYGLGTCQQRGINTINEVTQGSVYLLQSIQKSNEFFEELKQWKEKGFSYEQHKEWIEAGFQATDVDLVVFVRDNLDFSAEMVRNMENKEILKSAYQEHLRDQENQSRSQIQQVNPYTS